MTDYIDLRANNDDDAGELIEAIKRLGYRVNRADSEIAIHVVGNKSDD